VTSAQPKVRLGSMETVFTVLLITVGLYLVVALAPILLALLWVVLSIRLTLALIGASSMRCGTISAREDPSPVPAISAVRFGAPGLFC
jgi:hypothetical protein